MSESQPSRLWITEPHNHALQGPRELATPAAAAYLGVNVSTLRRYGIPFTQYRGRGRRRYRVEDLDAFRAAARTVPDPGPDDGGQPEVDGG